MLVDKGLAQRMRRNNYYGRTALRDIFEATILLNSTTDDRTDYYIEDSDGYTNVRESGSPKAKIITRIKSGSFVDVIKKNGGMVASKELITVRLDISTRVELDVISFFLRIG